MSLGFPKKEIRLNLQKHNDIEKKMQKVLNNSSRVDTFFEKKTWKRNSCYDRGFDLIEAILYNEEKNFFRITQNPINFNFVLKGSGMGFLHSCANNVKFMEFIFEIAPDLNVNQKDYYGLSPLHHSVWRGNAETSRLLISRGAEVNSVDGFDESPLFLAVRQSNVDLVKLLIENGSQNNLQNKRGKLPIELTDNSEIQDVIKYHLFKEVESLKKTWKLRFQQIVDEQDQSFEKIKMEQQDKLKAWDLKIKNEREKKSKIHEELQTILKKKGEILEKNKELCDEVKKFEFVNEKIKQEIENGRRNSSEKQSPKKDDVDREEQSGEMDHDLHPEIKRWSSMSEFQILYESNRRKSEHLMKENMVLLQKLKSVREKEERKWEKK